MLKSYARRLLSLVKVFVYDASGSTLGAQTLGPEHSDVTFSGLVPGRLYRAEVITHSGELTNAIRAVGRTSESTFRNRMIQL